MTTERLRGHARFEVWGAVVVIALGCAYALAALWAPWAVDGPHAGVMVDQDGWQWMLVGDVLMVAGLFTVVALVVALVLSPPSRVATWAVGMAALALIVLAAAGAAAVWWFTGWDFFVMDDGDLREYSPGIGPRRTLIGLGATAFGVLVAMHARAQDQPSYPPMQLGRLEGQIELRDDFDDPLELASPY